MVKEKKKREKSWQANEKIHHETLQIDEGATSSLVPVINDFCKLRYVMP